MYGSTCYSHVVPISGDPQVFFQILDTRNFPWKAFSSWWTWDSNPRPTTHGLSTMPFVRVLVVRWDTGKRLTNRLPKLRLTTLSPWTDRIHIIRVNVSPTRGSNFWGSTSIFEILQHEEINFSFKNVLHGGLELRTHDQRPMVLPTTPFVKALICWATGKRLTNRLSKLSLITLFPPLQTKPYQI